MTSAFDSSNVHCQRLAEQLQKQDVVAIVGAGASVAATYGGELAELAGWGGLLKHGVSHCKEVAGRDDRWVKRQLEALNDGDLDDWIGVAEQVE